MTKGRWHGSSLRDRLRLRSCAGRVRDHRAAGALSRAAHQGLQGLSRSEEHTSELQSRSDLVCRLLLEKKKLLLEEKHHELPRLHQYLGNWQVQSTCEPPY